MNDMPEGRSGVLRSIITALPPGFLLLVILNVVMLYVVMKNMDNQNDQRMKILMSVVERCLNHP